MLRHPGWAALDGLRHGFLDKAESAAGFPWESALAGVGVTEAVSTARQVHGATVVRAARDPDRPEADAVVSDERGLLVGIVTADCVPVLLLDRRTRVAAAAHAGWRGAATGVLEATIDRVRTAFGVEPAHLEAAVGPAVGACCYQVGPEVRAAFEARVGARVADAFTPDGERLRLDMRAAVRLLLADVGVTDVTVVGPCTSCTPTLASYRRDRERAGRQLSFIGWT